MGICGWGWTGMSCIPPVPSPRHSTIAGGAARLQSESGISTAFDGGDQLRHSRLHHVEPGTKQILLAGLPPSLGRIEPLCPAKNRSQQRIRVFDSTESPTPRSQENRSRNPIPAKSIAGNRRVPPDQSGNSGFFTDDEQSAVRRPRSSLAATWTVCGHVVMTRHQP